MSDMRRGFVALHCLGYGLFLLSYCSTVPLLAFFNQAVQSWAQALLVQFGFFAATGVGCLGVRALMRKGAAPSPLTANLASATAVCACFIACFMLADPLLSIGESVVLTLAMGASAAYPLVFWFSGLAQIYQRCGRVTCITALAASGLVAVVVALVVSPLRESRVGLLAVFLVAEVTCACCRAAIGRLKRADAAEAGAQGVAACERPGCRGISCASEASLGVEAREQSGCRGALCASQAARGNAAQSAVAFPCERYRLTAYSLSMLASLGVTVGLTGGFIVYFCALNKGAAAMEAVSVAPIVVFVVVAVLVRFLSEGRQPRFGMVARLLISITGFALALLPLLVHASPQFTFGLFKTVFALQGIVMMLFSIEVACENGLRVLNVMPVNYAFYCLMACLGAFAFWASQVYVGGRVAWEVIAAVGVLATVMVIPMLPAVSSAATAFTLEELPENEGREQRMERMRDGMAESFGLTGRESEVLYCLMEGLSRAEIADRLALSRWTVKDYMSSIYRKAGVHSYQELMALVQREA